MRLNTLYIDKKGRLQTKNGLGDNLPSAIDMQSMAAGVNIVKNEVHNSSQWRPREDRLLPNEVKKA